MAPLSHHLPSLLFLGFLYTSISGESPNTACPSFDCGNGVTLRYPFWHTSQQFQYCGYPGFNLTCDHQNPTIHLTSNNIYSIKQIDYSNKFLTLAYAELAESNCPRVPDGLRLTSTATPLFNATLGNKILHFFYNCTLYPPSLPHITCLLYGDMRSYVFVEGAIPEFDWRKYCGSIAVVPVIDKAVPDGNNLVHDFGEALQSGFKLTWIQPDGACQSCEASNGMCGYGNGLHKNFSCICSDGRHSLECYDKGAGGNMTGTSTVTVGVLVEPYYVAIGAVIFGGLVIAATVFYLIQKKKFGSYKPV